MFALLNIILFLFGISDSFDAELNQYLSNRLKEYSNYSYEIISLPSKSEDHNISLDKTRECKLNNGYMYIPVHIQPINGSSTNGYLTLKLKLFKDVYLSAEDMERGTELAEKSFIRTEKDITDLRTKAVGNLTELNNKRAKTRITKGEILSVNMIEEIPDIQIGEQIEAHLINGAVEITFEVKAKQDGYLNEVIRVLADNNRIYKAKVVNHKKVLIVE